MEKLMMILKLLPAIIVAIRTLEELLPGSGKGEQKLIAVREILESIDSSVINMWPQISSVSAVIVRTMNSNGGVK